MALQIRGTNYVIPGENGSAGPTGREIIEIELAFGLDGLELLGVLASDKPHPNAAYSKTKAMYAVAWICKTRAGEIVSIDDVLNQFSINEFMIVEDEKKDNPA